MESKQNKAFYLKYRPQSLDELIGQSHIKKILEGTFGENRLSHAYLFAGPKGTGKTSTARILAKMVNCSSKDKIPCNKCEACLSITDGSNLDLIEIDAASNRGVEDIRSLREKVKLAPSSGKKKVYIIDECHMLTTEAFNALLKTLEEPPAHTLFILATTDAQKLPQTILSRVQRLDFKQSSNEELMEALQKIIKIEKIDIESEALKLLIKKAEGSFRDGIKFLDQVSALGEKITAESLQKNIRLSQVEVILELIKFLSQKDTTSSLSFVTKQTGEGADPKEIITSLMDVFRSMVFLKNGLGEQLVKPNYSDEDYQVLEKLSESFENKDLILNLDILQKALQNLKTASIPSLPLELSLVEMCQDSPASIQKVEVQSPKAEEQTVKEFPQDESITVIPKQEMPEATTTITPALEGTSSDIQKLKDKWTLVLETIRPFNFSLEALLRSISITECTDTRVILEVPYSFHQRILEAPKNRDLLESVLSDVLGRSIQIIAVLGHRSPRSEDIQNIEVAADDEIIRVAAEIFSSDPVN